MGRFRATLNGPVPFTAEEEAARDAEEAAFAAEQAALAKTEYQRQRAAEYPPIGDQLDALWKGGEAAAAMLAQVQAVKTKYPKPE
jgi:hypothetical protein